MNRQRAETDIEQPRNGAVGAALALLSEGQRLPPQGRVLSWLIAALAVPLAAYEIWQALAGHAQPLEQAMIFVTAAYPVAFLTVSINRTVARRTPLDWMLAGLSLVAGAWFCWHADRYAQWIAGLDPFTLPDLVAALVFLALTLELRHVGRFKLCMNAAGSADAAAHLLHVTEDCGAVHLRTP